MSAHGEVSDEVIARVHHVISEATYGIEPSPDTLEVIHALLIHAAELLVVAPRQPGDVDVICAQLRSYIEEEETEAACAQLAKAGLLEEVPPSSAAREPIDPDDYADVREADRDVPGVREADEEDEASP